MRMGGGVDRVHSRPTLPEKLANFRLKTPTELAAELVHINDALSARAKKRRVQQDTVGPAS